MKIALSPNSNCLVVEDSEVRNDWFTRVLPNFDITTDVKSAIDHLNLHTYDIVFLDYDSVNYFVEPTDDGFLDKTFWRVAQHLHRIEYKGIVVIHSSNPVGANRMAALIRSVNPQVYVMPYGLFDIKIEE